MKNQIPDGCETVIFQTDSVLDSADRQPLRPIPAVRVVWLAEKSEHLILVLTSDQVISPLENFVSDCKKAADFAHQGKFVCFAIPPYEPSTGFGYINMGEPLDSENSVLKIESFKEKPDLETAKAYLASGKYAWNSGMFGFSNSLFESEIKKYENEMYEAFKVFDTAEFPKPELLNSIKYIENWQPLPLDQQKLRQRTS